MARCQTEGNDAAQSHEKLVRIVANSVEWRAVGPDSARSIHEAGSKCGGYETEIEKTTRSTISKEQVMFPGRSPVIAG